ELSPGSTTGVLKDADGGYTVLLVREVRGGETPPLSEIHAQVRQEVLNHRVQRLAPSFLEDLRNQAKVEIQAVPEE
ncbi:MAG: hypothetical protein WKH64_07660, partial [Chloroflexia bacterium]